MAIDEPKDGVPLRLYLQLEQGHHADLFVVTEATAALAAGVKELAYILDPSLDLYIGLGPSSPGSLWENTVLKAINDPQKRHNLYLLAGSALIWFFAPPMERVRDNLWQPYLDQYLPPPGSPERKDDLETMQRLGTANVAQQERRQVFRALDRDNGITAAGVSIEHRKPELLVPHTEFRALAGYSEVVTTEEDRITQEDFRATLVRPVLEAVPRRWKFRTSRGDLTATMRDLKFLEAVAMGRIGVPLRAGIEMDLLVETRERFSDSVWQIVDRNIIQVTDIHAPPSERQGSMFPE